MEENKEIPLKIAQLCINHFYNLPKTGKPLPNEWTILSCIVKQQNENLAIVALGTGTKCVGNSKMCPKGTVVNDSHAEIVCRRAFLKYLYEQLDNSSTIFNLNEENKFALKENVKFHFFTTQVPCGDAAIFVKEPATASDEHEDDIPNKKRKIDIYRTGAKCLENCPVKDAKTEGESYHLIGLVRTKPGRGDLSLSMSCSDKLTKWCHLGVQGALLSIFLASPIYLNYFIILKDTPFSHEAFQRALLDRIGNVEFILPYRRNIMDIHVVDVPFAFLKTDDKVPSSTSIIWYKSAENYLEVAVNGRKLGTTKKNILSEKSRLKICKLEIFKLFFNTMKKLNINSNNIDQISYKEAKMLAKNYQLNWNILKEKLGFWSKKDSKLLEFFVT